MPGFRYLRVPRDLSSYRTLRATMGRAILPGLERMVAADIIYTVAVESTLDTVLVLGLIVLIRTFISLSLEVEISGRWPWAGGEKWPPRSEAATLSVRFGLAFGRSCAGLRRRDAAFRRRWFARS
jgi:hypothetical protein